MRIKVSDILNYDMIVTKVAEAESYQKMLGQAEVMYVHMSGVEVEELWVQPSEHIQYKWNEAEHIIKGIFKTFRVT